LQESSTSGLRTSGRRASIGDEAAFRLDATGHRSASAEPLGGTVNGHPASSAWERCELRVEGVLDGRTVRALWSDGAVLGDATLIAVARAVVASQPPSPDGETRATFADLEGATLAFTVALDRLTSAEIVPRGPTRHSAQT
jgi:hypothetical protein